jgi:hypothetical protein
MMEKKLGEAGIAISFPHDVHIDTKNPLKIELVRGEKPSDLK